MYTATTLPVGYSLPSTVVAPTDHSAWITITSALCVCFVLGFLGLRVYIRTIISPPFRYDDMASSLATVLLHESTPIDVTLTVKEALFVIQSAVVFVQVSKGFGRSIDLLSSTALEEVQKVPWPEGKCSVQASPE